MVTYPVGMIKVYRNKYYIASILLHLFNKLTIKNHDFILPVFIGFRGKNNPIRP